MSVSFDESNLVDAGLLPAAVLAQRLDLTGLIDRRLHLGCHGANGGAKALSVIGSMLAGGDSIDDGAVLRAGAAASLFDGTRAPSTATPSRERPLRPCAARHRPPSAVLPGAVLNRAVAVALVCRPDGGAGTTDHGGGLLCRH